MDPEETARTAAASPAAAPPAIELRGVGLLVRGLEILRDASFEIGRGEVVLIVGESGAGKTLTLRLLAGLIRPGRDGFTVSGTLRMNGMPSPGRGSAGRAGVVFQEFALFDELTPSENIRFGLDHGPTRRRGDAAVRALLDEFRLPPAGAVADLSGGMKQRVAIARTLAFDAEILLFDEPTSGLDPALAARVAARIRRIHDVHGRTTVIVTHDVAALAPVADRVLLLDSRTRAFREVPPDRAAAALFEVVPAATAQIPAPARRRGTLRTLDRAVLAAADTVLAALTVLPALLPLYPRLRWGLRYLRHYLRLAAVGSAIPYVLLGGLVIGVVVTDFAWRFLPFKSYTAPLLREDVVSAVGYALYRIVAPGILLLMLAARSGAATAADIANRSLTRQLEALRTFRVPPERYLLTNILAAFLVGTPLLFLVLYLGARYAALAVFILEHGNQSPAFFRDHLDRFLDRGGPFFEGTGYVLAKLLIGAAGVGRIAFALGSRRMASGRDVSRAVTGTIIWATVWVLLVQLAFAFFEFRTLG